MFHSTQDPSATAIASTNTKLDTLHTDLTATNTAIAATTAAVVAKTPNAGTFVHGDSTLDPDTPTSIAGANAARLFVLCVNTGANALKLAVDGTAASATNGIPIAAGQGYDFPPHVCPKGTISAWSLAGTTIHMTLA